ncbi:MAG: fused MFS/spermidine synthase [Planctomycetota bacterium]|jgi:MFS family permease
MSSPPVDAADPAPPRSLRRRLACNGVVFCTGAVIIVHEILAAGFVAPVFGSGMDVWGAVLSVTLLALALGYFVGGLRLERLAGPRSLPCLVAAAGIALLASTGIALGLSPRSVPITGLQLVLSVSMVLGPPILLLAVVTPWMVQIYSRTGALPGRSAAVLYAVSTLGGVIAALVAGFWWIPWLGLRLTAVVNGWLLIAAVLLWGLLEVRGRRYSVVAGLVLGVVVLACQWGIVPGEVRVGRLDGGEGIEGLERVDPLDRVAVGPAGRPQLVLREDSFYGRREVYSDGVSLYLLVNGILQTSAPLVPTGVFEPGALLAAGNALELVPYLRPDARRVLLIGLGGGAVARQMGSRGYGLEVECVELDAGIVRIARKHFGFEGECTEEDGRRYLSRCEGGYDVVLLDVYQGETLPRHMCTVEFFGLGRRKLADPEKGLMCMNLIGTVGEGADDTRAILKTVARVFPEMVLFSGAGGDPNTLYPMTLCASRGAVEDVTTADRLREARLTMPPRVQLEALFWEDAPLLTDDRNPLAVLRRQTARRWRQASVGRYGVGR